MRILFVLLVSLLANFRTAAQVQLVDAAWKIPAHPRLLMTTADEENIRKSIQPGTVWKTVQDAILRQCDSVLTLKPSERVMTGIRLDTYRLCEYRIFYLSYAWRITHQKKYFDQAEKELLAVCNFSDWNPSHFLDVVEINFAVAIGYDWLYNDLPASERALIRQAILVKGIAPSYDTAYHAYRKWLSVTNNWNQVCNTGISYGAMAVFEDDPKFAADVINRSLKSIVISMKDYEPDGAYAEGYGYWSYGSTYNVLFISGLQKMFKTSFGLDQQSGFLKSAGYIQNMVGPTDQCFNYSDVAAHVAIQPAMFWFADHLKDKSLLWEDRHFLSPDMIQSQMQYRFMPAVMIWGAGIGLSDITAPKTKCWEGAGRNPVALMRSSWTDPNAVFAGIKGGSPSVTHGHMDIGSFVMEAEGVRWAMDFGYQDYESLESRHIDLWEDKQDGQRWKIFRYNNFAHSTLTVNNQLQQVKGQAPITHFTKQPAFMSAIVDMSSSYQGQLAQALRGIALCNNAYVVVRDELTAADTATTVRWSMLTPATVRITGKNTAELTKDGKILTLVVEGAGSITLKTWPTDPPPEPYDTPNPGTTRVGFEISLTSSQKLACNVFLLPGKTSMTSVTPVNILQNWQE